MLGIRIGAPFQTAKVPIGPGTRTFGQFNSFDAHTGKQYALVVICLYIQYICQSDGTGERYTMCIRLNYEIRNFKFKNVEMDVISSLRQFKTCFGRPHCNII